MSPEKLAFQARRLQPFAPLFYAAALIWVNIRICRDLFRHTNIPTNSMHGFWATIAQMGNGAWFHATWWPWWDNGIPFELTYAPGVPLATHLISSATHVSALLAFNMVSGGVYLLGPLTLFLMAWWLSSSPGYSFLAALAYSLTAPTQLLAPDANFAWKNFWDARRLYLTIQWDEAPHLAALCFLPIVVIFLALSLRKRRLVYYAAAAASIALAALCSAFGPTDTILIAVCLFAVLDRKMLASNIAITAGIGVAAWAVVAPYLSPEVLRAIRESSDGDGTGWKSSSWLALGIAVAGFIVLQRLLRRSSLTWQVQFLGLFAWLASVVPLTAEYLHIQFLPQPGRYKFEMEMAVVLLAVFALRPWVDRLPVAARAGLLVVILIPVPRQISNYRRYAKAELAPRDTADLLENRVTLWASRNLPGVRLFLPGSVSKWGQLWNPVPQFTGSSWSMAYNQVQQKSIYSVEGEPTANQPLTWLRAFGVGAICVVGPKSPEYWKSMRYPDKFKGLPVLWSEDDTTIYAVPGKTRSLAHVVPATAIVRDRIKENYEYPKLEPFVAALEDTSLPDAPLNWQDNNHFVVDLPQDSGHALSVQVSWHPGWHAHVDGRPLPISLPIHKDGLGLMWLEPRCAGPCQIRFTYEGTAQLMALRWLSFTAAVALIALLISSAYRSIRARQVSTAVSSAPVSSPG